LSSAETSPENQLAGPSQSSPEAADGQAPAEREGPQEGQEKKDDKLAGSFLAELRKAARRALFTLFLAGMAFSPAKMARGQEALLLGTPETPIISELINDDLKNLKSPGLICLSSNYLGRNMDLRVVSDGDLAQGQPKVEEKAQEMIASQAQNWGFGQETYLRLVRLAYDRQAKVDLRDLEGDKAPLKLLKPHLPIFTKALEETGLVNDLAAPVMAAVLDFTPIEGAFWDRFFIRARLSLKDNRQAVKALVWHLMARPRRLNRARAINFNPKGWPNDFKRLRPMASTPGPKNQSGFAPSPEPQSAQTNPSLQKQPGQKPNFTQTRLCFEYAGLKAPFYSLEHMEIEKAVDFLESFISKTWGRDFSKAKKRGQITRPLAKGFEVRRLASDLLQIAYLNHLPRTIFVAMVHADFETSALWPNTLELYGWGQRLTDLFYNQSVIWSESQPRLLDFDRVYDYLYSVAKSNQLEICHLKLQNFLQTAFSPKVSVFEGAINKPIVTKSPIANLKRS
jgi:hypothetical protein